jgi:hypothetical protein
MSYLAVCFHIGGKNTKGFQLFWSGSRLFLKTQPTHKNGPFSSNTDAIALSDG